MNPNAEACLELRDRRIWCLLCNESWPVGPNTERVQIGSIDTRAIFRHFAVDHGWFELAPYAFPERETG